MNDGNGAARRRVLWAGAIGNFVEWYDFAMYGVFATTIATVFFPKSDPTAALLSTFAIYALAYVVRPLGGIVFGRLGDRLGRRSALLWSIMLMSASTVAMGLLPGYAQIGIAAPALLLLCRMGQSFSTGGEYTGSTVFVVEYAPYGQRGRYASIPPMASTLPAAVAVLVGLAMTSTTTPEQLISWGWRVPFLAAVPLALIGLYLRRRVAESPEFVAARTEGQIESAPVVMALKVAKKSMLMVIGYAIAYVVAFFLFQTFLLSYLTVTVKFSKTDSLVVSLVFDLVLVAACVLAGYAIDRVGRKRIAVGSVLGVGVWAVPTFVLLEHATVLGASLVVAVCSLLFGGVFTTMSLAVVELFPVRVRSSASALAYNIVAIFGGTVPYVATWLVGRGYPLAPGYYLAGLCAVAGVVAAIGIGNRAQANSRNDVELGENARQH